MTMQILTISLYGKNGERRDVKFNLGQVNIITGASKRGKSSLIDILEYCFGSSECNVADGLIRESVIWYSVLVQFSDMQVFIARQSPGLGQKSNTRCHLITSNKVEIPLLSELSASTNIDSVLNFLTTKTGIPEQVTEVPEGQTRSKIRVGFKHSKYYLFQSQDELASKRVLFHRQAEPHLPQAIKDTFPYFMGAAEDDRLFEVEKLRKLKREKAAIEKRVKEVESIRGEGLQKGFQILAEASTLGFYTGDLTPKDDDLLIVLKQIAKWVPSEDEGTEMITEGEDSYYQLDKQYRSLTEQKRIIRAKIRSAQEYTDSIYGFEGELKEQALRLNSIGLYNKIVTRNECPVCESEHESIGPVESIIKRRIEELDSKLSGVSRNKPRITDHLQTLQEDEARLAGMIKKIKVSMEGLKEQEVKISTKSILDDRKSRLIGRVSLYLESVDWSKDTKSLKDQISILISQIEELENKLDNSTLSETIDAQLSCLSEDMSTWARELGLEHSEHPIRLDMSNLTVVAETPRGRTPLTRMGSGENWVGYHLVTYFALAKWFIEQNRPVARFIFFDQPTQVYFPSDHDDTGNIDEIQSDEDREAVKRMFEWIFKVAKELSPHLQVIITDHADIDEEWFQKAIVDTKWRGDNALIPKHWIEI